MQRVMVIGCSGSGKSTFARQLHLATQLPLLHLDKAYWKPNWVEPSKPEWRATITELVAQDQWVMDGNYSGTWDLRIPRADTIIFLNKPTYVCLYRVIKRIMQNLGKTREDMTEGCPERFDLLFFHYVLNYNRTRRKGILEKLNGLKGEKQIYVLRKNHEIQSFLKNITPS